jgi:hypothetical protein
MCYTAIQEALIRRRVETEVVVRVGISRIDAYVAILQFAYFVLRGTRSSSIHGRREFLLDVDFACFDSRILGIALLRIVGIVD